MGEKDTTNQIVENGFFWMNVTNTDNRMRISQSLTIVMQNGLRFYVFDDINCKCDKKRSLSLKVHSCWFSSKSRYLLISSSSTSNEIYQFYFNELIPQKYKSIITNGKIEEYEIFIKQIYNNFYCIQLNGNKAELTVTRLGDEEELRYRRYKLYLFILLLFYLIYRAEVGQYKLNIVDNIIVVHNTDTKQTYLYDLRVDDESV